MVPAAVKRLLIVDDESDLRELLVEEFRRRGWETFEASDGQSAFQIFQARGADVVVSDIRMPGLSGIDLLRRIQALPADRRPAVILMTGFSDVAVREAKALGAKAVLHKPFDLTLLIQEVERYAPAREAIEES